MFLDEFEEVAPIRVLHDEVEDVGFVVVDGFVVGDDVGAREGGEESDFVEGVVFGLIVEGVDVDLDEERSTFLMA